MNVVGNAPFRIGEWRIDPTLDEISRDATPVKLEPRTMRVLVCLAQRAGEVVSIKQLLETVWKDLVVTQYSVYQAVRVLRCALGDDPKDPTYIATVRRRGYRLVAPVGPDAQAQHPVDSPVEASSEADLQEQWLPLTQESPDDSRHIAPVETDEVKTFGRRMGLRYGSILIALLVLVGCMWWFFVRLGHEHSSGTSAARPIRAEATSALFTPPRHSVAVLPFSNLSGDPKQDYFSDGMTEEVINALSQNDAMKVIARTSSSSFKGKDADIGAIARKLNVEAILEGSVRRSGKKVRITAELINGVNGFHIWSQDYDRDLSDVLVLQTDIARSVAYELQASAYLKTSDVAQQESEVVRSSSSVARTGLTRLN